MIRRHRRLLINLFLVAAAWLLAPETAYADNCSSLNDCYYTLRAALAAAVGLGVFAALMAIGLDIGPLAGNLRKRFDGVTGAEGATGDGADVWDRSLGVVSVEGMVAESAPASAAADQAPAPEGGVPESAAGERTLDRARDVAAASGEGRQAPQAGEGTAPAEGQTADVSDVADRAQEATQIAGEHDDAGRLAEKAPGSEQATASTQGEAPRATAAEERPRAFEQAERAKRVPEQAAGASEQGQPPAETSSGEARMRQGAADSDVAGEAQRIDQAASADSELAAETGAQDQAPPAAERTADQMRGDTPATPGRSGEGSVDVTGGAAGDVEGGSVAERAQEVAEAFEPPEREGMAQASKQVQMPEGEGMAQESTQGEAPSQAAAPREAAQQSAKPVGTEPPADLRSEQQGASTQSSGPPQEAAPATSGRQAQATDRVATTSNVDVARDLARMYGDLSRVPGVRLLLQQVAFHGRWATRGAAAQLAIARHLGQQGADLVTLEDGGRGADIVVRNGPVVEVKDYYWPGPFFQREDHIASATRRLVRQVELLRRRYADGDVQVAFSDAQRIPRQLRIVLQSIDVELAPGIGGTATGPEVVAGATFVERLRGMTAEQYWQSMIACGWQAADSALQTRVNEAFERDPASAWLALAVLAFDAESIYETSPLGESYRAHLQEMARASQGAFRPEDITERVQEETHEVTFVHGGRRYGVRTPAASDYFSQRVLDVVNDAMVHRGDARRFRPLPAPDQLIYLTFVSEETVRRSVEEGLIPAPSPAG